MFFVNLGFMDFVIQMKMKENVLRRKHLTIIPLDLRDKEKEKNIPVDVNIVKCSFLKK